MEIEKTTWAWQIENGITPGNMRIALNRDEMKFLPQEVTPRAIQETISRCSYAGEPVIKNLVYKCTICENDLRPESASLGPCPCCSGGEYTTYISV